MAEDNSGEKTEKPTPKKLRDARARGEVAHSQSLDLTIGLAVSLVILTPLFSVGTERLAALLNAVLSVDQSVPFLQQVTGIGREAFITTLILSAMVLLPIALMGLISAFLQVGPVMAMDKLTPRLSNLDPVAGLRRMFSADSLIESLKAVFLSAALLGILGWIIYAGLHDLLRITLASPVTLADAILHGVTKLLLWTLGVMILIAILDIAWQKHSFEKKMRMSLKDLKDEHKNREGDPQTRGERRKLARKWSREGAKKTASSASVLVVNPVHIAIALLYDEEETPVPVVIGRGEEGVARDMRDAANKAGVPVLRNEQLARTLLRDTRDGEVVPRELFPIVAEITLWALRVRERIEQRRDGLTDDNTVAMPPTPGEDLSCYDNLS